MDLISGQLLMQREVDGHVQDRNLGPGLLLLVVQDDLVLRDMGYFDVAAFAEIETGHAFWLSRIHLHALILAPMIFSAMAVRINGLIVIQQSRLQTSVEKLFGWLSSVE
jgi:hypothetical protein